MNDRERNDAPLICTIGHSNRPIEVFLDLLKENEVTRVLDIRTVPRSRRNPQFAQDALPLHLAEAGIDYTYIAALGGLRKTHADSPNTAWRNLSFRGYADHMQSAEFEAGLEEVMHLAARERCALMCAEAVPWRCHRSLVGDALLVRGLRVENIINSGRRQPHRLTPFAQVEGLVITYPPLQAEEVDEVDVQADEKAGEGQGNTFPKKPVKARVRESVRAR